MHISEIYPIYPRPNFHYKKGTADNKVVFQNDVK